MTTNRHQFTPAERSRGGRSSSTKFRRGPDRRRHVFSRAECAAGGRRSWDLFMIRYRVGCGLPVPLHLCGLVEHALGVNPRGRDERSIA